MKGGFGMATSKLGLLVLFILVKSVCLCKKKKKIQRSFTSLQTALLTSYFDHQTLYTTKTLTHEAILSLWVYLGNNNNNNDHHLVARNSQRICTYILTSTYTCIDTILFSLCLCALTSDNIPRVPVMRSFFICLFCCHERDVKMEKKPRSAASAVEELHSLHVIKEIIVGSCEKKKNTNAARTRHVFAFHESLWKASSLRWKCKLKCNSF